MNSLKSFSLRELLEFQVVGPDMQPLGRIVDVRVGTEEGTCELHFRQDNEPYWDRVSAWKDIIFLPGRGKIMVDPELLVWRLSNRS